MLLASTCNVTFMNETLLAPITQPKSAVYDKPILWLLALFVLSIATPFIPVPNLITAQISGVLLTAIYVFFVMRLVNALGILRPSVRKALLWLLITGALWALSEWVLRPYLGNAIRSAGQPTPQALQTLGLLNFTIRPLCLMLAAMSGGALLSHLVRYPNMVGPICAATALIDIWGVMFGGIVSQMLQSEKTKGVAEKAMAAMPKIGTATGSNYSVEIASIGAGDFLFLGLFFTILHSHQMNARGALNWVTPLITIALLLIVSGIVPFLPGLLFIGLGVAIPNWKFFQFTRDERFALLWAGLLVLVLTIALYFIISAQLQAPPSAQLSRPPKA